MNRGQMQRDFRLNVIRKIKEFPLHRRIVEKLPSGRSAVIADARAGGSVQLVKLLQTVFLKQAEHRLAPEAAKNFFSRDKAIVRTRLATVKASAGRPVDFCR